MLYSNAFVIKHNCDYKNRVFCRIYHNYKRVNHSFNM